MSEEKQLPAVAARVLTLAPVVTQEVALHQLKEFQSFIKSYFVEGEDFGKIPGAPKATLLKPGADKLCEVYGFYDDYAVTQRTEDWQAEPPLFDYEFTCSLRSKRDDSVVATGMGSCNSYENKYRWRQAERVCPSCGKATIIKGKAEYGGGWLCFAKKGGCNAKYKDGDGAIEAQETGRVPNDDIATLKNTILKMAKKRSKIDAVLSATRSSGIFTQDIEDFVIVNSSPVVAHEEVVAVEVVAEPKPLDANQVTQSFAPFSVTLKHITERFGKELSAFTASDADALFDLYDQLSNGVSASSLFVFAKPADKPKPRAGKVEPAANPSLPDDASIAVITIAPIGNPPEPDAAPQAKPAAPAPKKMLF